MFIKVKNTPKAKFGGLLLFFIGMNNDTFKLSC